MRKEKIGAVLLALLVGATLSGCSAGAAGAASSTSESSATEAVAENPYGGFPVDPPSDDEVVLTVTGAESVDYTIPELRALAETEVEIYEPFVKENQTFVGVNLGTLFEASGIEATDEVLTIALNDYRYQDKASAFTASNGVLAVERNGEIIPMDAGGPIRIIFPDGNEYPDYLDAWNWSLRSIEVAE